MANTFELISSNTVGSGGVADITFSSIPATFTDLCLLISERTNRSVYNDYLKIGFNGTTTLITYTGLEGNSTGANAYNTSAAAQLIGEAEGNTATANTFDNFQIYIPNYASSNNKSYSVDFVTENNFSTTNAAFAGFNAGLWSNSAAITSIKITPGIGSLIVEHSTAYLYGIKNS